MRGPQHSAPQNKFSPEFRDIFSVSIPIEALKWLEESYRSLVSFKNCYRPLYKYPLSTHPNTSSFFFLSFRLPLFLCSFAQLTHNTMLLKPPISSFNIEQSSTLPAIHSPSTTTIDTASDSAFQSTTTTKLHQPAQLSSNYHPSIANLSNTPSSPTNIHAHPQHPAALFLSQNRPHNIAFTPVSQAPQETPASAPTSFSQSSLAAGRLPKPKMTSPKNAKRDIHAPDLAYEDRYPVQAVPDNTNIPPEQQALMPDPATDIVMKKYATSVDERNFLTVHEYCVNNQWVMWDYFTGYVHLTGLWKAIGNNKADIVKLVDNSPDLEPMIRRVRGGFLKIQGTWVPFQVAQALAARTCFHIRYALIPIFGKEFPESCLKPHEPGFGQLQLHLSNTPKRRRKRVPAPPSSATTTSTSSSHSSSADNLVSLADTLRPSSPSSAAQPLPHKRPKSSTNFSKRQLPISAATAGAASPPFLHVAPPPDGLAPLPIQHHLHHHLQQHQHPNFFHQHTQFNNCQSSTPGPSSLTTPQVPPLSAGPPPPYHTAGAAAAATPVLYSQPLSAVAAASPSPSLFYASPQTIPAGAPAGWQAHPDYSRRNSPSLSSHDVVYAGSSSSDDDEPLLMAPTSTGVTSLAMIAAAARSASGINSHHHGPGHGHGHYRYKQQQHSNRLLSSSSGVSTPNSSLPNSPVLVEKTESCAVPSQYHSQMSLHWSSAPITPPPAEDNVSQAAAASTKPLHQMSILAAVADAVSHTSGSAPAIPPPIPTTTPHPPPGCANHTSAPFSFDSKPTPTTAPAGKPMWPWTGQNGDKVILPLPGSSPSSSYGSGRSAAPASLCGLARAARSPGTKAMSINNLLC